MQRLSGKNEKDDEIQAVQSTNLRTFNFANFVKIKNRAHLKVF